MKALYLLAVVVACSVLCAGCGDPDSGAEPTLTASATDTDSDSDTVTASAPDTVTASGSDTDTDPDTASDPDPDTASDPDSASDAGNSGKKPPSYPLDDVLRINHMQVKGTHNSYHLKMNDQVIPQWNYAFDPLDVQLSKQGVRQLELDVHYKPGKPKATWEVLHVPFVDAKSNCKTLTECLTLTKTWSDTNPGHHLLFILIEPKDDLDTNKIVGHYDELDDAILAVWPKNRVLRPDDVRGKHPTIRDALLKDGWPTLGKTRNKAMFVMLNSGHHRDNYLKGHPNLEDRVIFARGGEGKPWGCILEINNAQGETAKIQDAVKAGYLVRSKADDPDKSDEANDKKSVAALASGAHLISSDFPTAVPGKKHVFDVPGGNPSRCNPISGPKACTSKAIEDL